MEKKAFTTIGKRLVLGVGTLFISMTIFAQDQSNPPPKLPPGLKNAPPPKQELVQPSAPPPGKEGELPAMTKDGKPIKPERKPPPSWQEQVEQSQKSWQTQRQEAVDAWSKQRQQSQDNWKKQQERAEEQWLKQSGQKSKQAPSLETFDPDKKKPKSQGSNSSSTGGSGESTWDSLY